MQSNRNTWFVHCLSDSEIHQQVFVDARRHCQTLAYWMIERTSRDNVHAYHFEVPRNNLRRSIQSHHCSYLLLSVASIIVYQDKCGWLHSELASGFIYTEPFISVHHFIDQLSVKISKTDALKSSYNHVLLKMIIIMN